MPMHFTAMGCLYNPMQGRSIEIILISWLAFSLCKCACSEDCPDAHGCHGKQRSIWKMVLH